LIIFSLFKKHIYQSSQENYAVIFRGVHQ